MEKDLEAQSSFKLEFSGGELVYEFLPIRQILYNRYVEPIANCDVCGNVFASDYLANLSAIQHSFSQQIRLYGFPVIPGWLKCNTDGTFYEEKWQRSNSAHVVISSSFGSHEHCQCKDKLWVMMEMNLLALGWTDYRLVQRRQQ